MQIYGQIYKITNNLNGKEYVGLTTQKLEHRWADHFRANSIIGNALRKYGGDNFTFEKVIDCYSIEELNMAEILFIRYFDSANSGYNATLGGMFVGRHNFETRAKYLSKREPKGSSKYLGVGYRKDSNKYRARYGRHSRNTDINIGHYDSEIEAAKAYDRVIYYMYGDKAYLNFPFLVDEYKKYVPPEHLKRKIEKALKMMTA